MFAQLMGLKTIAPEDLNELIRNGRAVVIDVNAPLGWNTARVPGSINLDPLKYAEGELPQSKDEMLVFYCSNFMCRKAPNAARRARQMGYRNIRVMSAGISGWLAAKLPTESGANS